MIRHYGNIFVWKGYLKRIVFLLLYFIIFLLYFSLFPWYSVFFLVIGFLDEGLVDSLRHVGVFLLLHENIGFLGIGGFLLLLDEADLGRLLMQKRLVFGFVGVGLDVGEGEGLGSLYEIVVVGGLRCVSVYIGGVGKGEIDVMEIGLVAVEVGGGGKIVGVVRAGFGAVVDVVLFVFLVLGLRDILLVIDEWMIIGFSLHNPQFALLVTHQPRI